MMEKGRRGPIRRESATERRARADMREQTRRARDLIGMGTPDVTPQEGKDIPIFPGLGRQVDIPGKPVPVEEILATTEITDAKSISTLIKRIQREHYAPDLGYEPVLVYQKQYLDKRMNTALKEKLITPEDLPATIINYDFGGDFPGTVANFSVKTALGEDIGTRFNSSDLDLDSDTKFAVNADILDAHGRTLAQMERGYRLILLNDDLKYPLPNWYKEFYGGDTLKGKKPLWFATSPLHSKTWRPVIFEEVTKHRASVQRADMIAQRSLFKPYQGGLPGLGKDK